VPSPAEVLLVVQRKAVEGFSATRAGRRRAVHRGGAPDLHRVPRRQWGSGDRHRAQFRRRLVSVSAAAGPEPAPVGRRLARGHGPGHLGQPALHGLCRIRALDTARDARRPGRRRGRARDPVPASRSGPGGGAVADAGTPGDRVRRDLHPGPVAPPLPRGRRTGGAASGRAETDPGQARVRPAQDGPMWILPA
jgi:hypothetical protein